MTLLAHRARAVLALSLAALLLGACKDEAAPAAPAEPEVAATPAAAEAPPATAPSVPNPEVLMPTTLPEPVLDTTPVDTVISRVDSSNAASDTELTGPLGDRYKPTDSVFLDIRTGGTAETYTISSKWYFPDGSVITENSQIVHGAGPVSTIFSMSKPDGWAPGEYKVELSINGKLQQTKTFVVE